MAYRLRYHSAIAREDLPRIDRRMQERIRRAIEQRLTLQPTYYGEPLRHRLKGYWKLRVGDYRVIFQMAGDEVRILVVGHRRQVYEAPLRQFP